MVFEKMSNLTRLPDSELTLNIKQLVQIDRDNLITLIAHLQEFEGRRLFSEYGYDSMFSYCIKELRYTEQETIYRLRTSRLIKKCPELATSLKNGEINLTQAQMLNTFINNQEKQGKSLDKTQMLATADQIKNKSAKESMSILNLIEGKSPVKKENSLREIGDGNYLLKVTINNETAQLLKKIQGLLAHKKTIDANNLEEVINRMCELSLDELEPPPPSSTSVNTSEDSTKNKSRYIPAVVKSIDYHRANGQCEYVSPNGKKCNAIHALEYSHITPFAYGGGSSADNLKLYFRNHNQRDAINIFGATHMAHGCLIKINEY